MARRTSAATRIGPSRANARDAIVEAAVGLFDKQGYEATSVQEVVERAGVTKGSFYYHFTSKEDMLLLIHDTFIDHQLEVLDSITSGVGSPRESLALLIEEIVVGVETYQPHQRIFYEQHRFLSDERFQRVKAKRSEFERRVVRLIQKGVELGEFRPVDSPQVMAFGLIGMSAWTYHWYRAGDMTARDIGKLYATVVIDGLAATR